MSVLPGLGLTEPTAQPQNEPAQPATISIPAGSEWRFEINFLATTRVKLVDGTAELFGTELGPGQTYTFSGMKGAIYTWHGCTLEVSQGDPVSPNLSGLQSSTVTPSGPGPGIGGCQVEYMAEETPMMEFANVHFALETMREKARLTGVQGPRVLILGPEDAGKTSLTKILTAYATKRGRQPIVVNLDPSEGMLSVPPGGLTATAFRSMIDIEQGWGSSPISGPTPVPVKLPLVYFYGLRSPLDADGSLYKPLVTRLGVAVAGRLAEDQDARQAGIIVDAPGILGSGKNGANETIHHIITEFSISTILVLGSERLYSTTHRTYHDKPVSTSQPSENDERIQVVKLTKSGGCVDRDENFMKSVREAQIREYFFGRSVISTAVPSGASTAGTVLTLSPHAQQVDFNSLAIYNVTTAEDDDDYDPAAFGLQNSSFLPGGNEDEDEGRDASAPEAGQLGQSQIPLARLPKHTAEVPVPMALENTILAVTNAEPEAHLQDIREASVLGFAYISHVDEKKGWVRILLPTSGRVPNKAMIWGRKWPGEAVGLLG